MITDDQLTHVVHELQSMLISCITYNLERPIMWLDQQTFDDLAQAIDRRSKIKNTVPLQIMGRELQVSRIMGFPIHIVREVRS